MDVVRLIVETLLTEAVESLLHSTSASEYAASPYDPYFLASRPLPRLRLFPHPRAISDEAARRIIGSSVR